jgi:hypothetical protein
MEGCMKLSRVPDVSGRYKISPYTFYGWHSRKKFPNLFAKVGKILFVDEDELRHIAKESKETSREGVRDA